MLLGPVRGSNSSNFKCGVARVGGLVKIWGASAHKEGEPVRCDSFERKLQRIRRAGIAVVSHHILHEATNVTRLFRRCSNEE